MFLRPCPEHRRPEYLDVIAAVVVVDHDHSNEEEFFTEAVCPEDFGECFSNYVYRVLERTCTYRRDDQVLDLGLAGCREDRPPQPAELVIKVTVATCLLLVAEASCGGRDHRERLGVGEEGEVAGLVPA